MTRDTKGGCPAAPEVCGHLDCQVCAEAAVALRASDATALRERLAGAIDDAYVLAMERSRSAYRDGYCDGLELAEAIVRGTP